MQTQTGKGFLGMWRRVWVGGSLCSLYYMGLIEAGDYLVFECVGTPSGPSWDWVQWTELDNQ